MKYSKTVFMTNVLLNVFPANIYFLSLKCRLLFASFTPDKVYNGSEHYKP